jgi:hypothetical protein
MPFGQPILDAGIGLPGTPQEDVIRQRALAERMKKFERESMAQGMRYNPSASGMAKIFTEMDKYGFDPPPEQTEYFGLPERQVGVDQNGNPMILPGIPPIEINPATGMRNEPSNLWDIPFRSAPDWSPEGLADPRHLEKVENWERYQRDKESRGTYVPPPIPGLPPGFPGLRQPLPATKVYSAPLPPPSLRPLAG